MRWESRPTSILAKINAKIRVRSFTFFLKPLVRLGEIIRQTPHTLWNFWEVFTDDLNSLLRNYFLELSNEVQVWKQIVDCRFQGYGVPCYLLPHKSQVLDMWWISFMFKVVRQGERWQEIGKWKGATMAAIWNESQCIHCVRTKPNWNWNVQYTLQSPTGQ
jgi:hypothetical protein